MTDPFAHAIEEIARESQQYIRPAKILDQDGQTLSSGDAYLREGDACQTFWPTGNVPLDNPEKAVSVQDWQGKTLLLEGFYLCGSNPPHYHFRIQGWNVEEAQDG